MLRDQLDDEQTKKVTKRRRKQASRIEALVTAIVTGELFMNYPARPQFNPVPDSFEDGQHYIDIWEPLFFYEIYNILSSNRGGRGAEN